MAIDGITELEKDARELRRFLGLRDDIENRMAWLQAKIIRNLGGQIAAREYLDGFGVELGREGHAPAKSKNFMDFVRADREQT